MLRKILPFCVFFLSLTLLPAQTPAPGKVQKEAVLIVNAILHDGNGNRLENAWLRADGGKITAAGSGQPDAAQLANARRIDAGGAHLYPGFILMNNPVGLVEVESVRATLDAQETGADNPNAHSLPAYNTDSDVIPTLRLNGVLMAQVCPRGGRISGQSSVVQLDAWNWEDAVVKERDGLHINWPARWQSTGWWAEPSGIIEKNKEYQNQVNELHRLFEEAGQYLNNRNHVLNPKLESMSGVLQGKIRLYLHAGTSAEMLAALGFAKAQGITDPVLVAGPAVIEILPYLQENNIPVVLHRLHDLPEQSDAQVFQSMHVPAQLKKAGILFALDYEGSMEAMGSRNLGFVAGATRAYGFSDEEALSLITRNPAQILGIDSRCGTISPGKDATFFLSKGNALEMNGQQLSRAWIQGREITLESKQTLLYQKFGKMLSEGR